MRASSVSRSGFVQINFSKGDLALAQSKLAADVHIEASDIKAVIPAININLILFSPNK
jgi:hypothetical protein